MDRAAQVALRDECTRLVEAGVLRQVAQSQRWRGAYMPTYVLPKAGGKWRLISDPRWLFAMEDEGQPLIHHKQGTAESVFSIVEKDDFLTSIDITKAFYHIPVAEEDRALLRFVVPGPTPRTLRHLEYRGMPMGLRQSPRNLALLVNPLIAELRREGIKVAPYVDDLLIAAPTPEAARAATRRVLDTLRHYGWVINESKCQLVPRQRMEHLGLAVDSTSMSVVLPGAKRRQIARESAALANTAPTSAVIIREAQRALGRIEHATVAVLGLRPATHAFRRWLAANARRHHASLSEAARRELAAVGRWISRWNGRTLRHHVRERPVDEIVSVDASPWAWGAHTRVSDSETYEFFNSEVRQLQHNLRELTGAARALAAFEDAGKLGRRQADGTPQRNWRRVVVRIDNRTATYYLNHGSGRSATCTAIGSRVADWARRHQIHLEARWIPGTDMVRADALSRLAWDHDDWRLSEAARASIISHVGRPALDLFATVDNKVCDRFVAGRPTPGALAVDALACHQQWSDLANGLAWINPPFRILDRVVQRAQQDKNLHAVVITPWTASTWWPRLMQRAHGPPRMCLPAQRNLCIPARTMKPVGKAPWDLAVWVLYPQHA